MGSTFRFRQQHHVMRHYPGWDALPKGASNTLSLLASTHEQIVWHGADAKGSLNQVQEKADAYVACLRRCVAAEGDTCLNACAQ
jgi:hypothetical protein